MKKLALVLLMVMLAAVVIPLTRSPYRVGMSKDKVMDDLNARAITQMNLRMQKQPIFTRIAAHGSSGVLEISTEYELRRNHVFLTRWHTCKVDTTGLITDVQSDWVWNGLP